MCRISQCCCCMTLRVGSYLSGAYSMFLGTIGVIVCAVAAGIIEVSLGALDRHTAARDRNATETGKNIIRIILYVTLAVYVLWVITAIILVIGVNKSKRGMLIPWIVVTSILTALSGLTIIFSLVSFGATFASASTIVQFLIQCAIFILNIYALIGVSSFYRNDCVEVDGGGKHNVV